MRKNVKRILLLTVLLLTVCMIKVYADSEFPGLESSINDVKKILDDKVLFANNELWNMDENHTKITSKYASNVKDYQDTIQIVKKSEFLRRYANIILSKDNVLSIKGFKISFKIKDVKKVIQSGFLKKDGTFYRYTLLSSGKVSYKKVDTKVTNIMDSPQGFLYIKNGKTYASNVFDLNSKGNIATTKLLINKEVIDTGDLDVNDGERHWILTKDGDLYTYSVNSSTKNKYGNYYKFTKINTKKVKQVFTKYSSDVRYKTTDGEIYSDTTKVEVVSIKTVKTREDKDILEFKSNGKVYLNDTIIMDKVKSINGTIECTDPDQIMGLITRSDGSIWNIVMENGEVKSSTKIRSGKLSAKRLSKPTKITVKKYATRSVKMTWNKVGGTKKYAIYRATSKNGKYKKIGTTTSTSYIDKTTKKGKTYYYKMSAQHSKTQYNSLYTTPIKIKR